MNGIKGLIIKDFLQLKSYRKTIIIFMIIFILTSLTQDREKGTTNMLVILLTLGFGMFSVASFNYDEMTKADRYILTLPLSKKQVILAKYLLIIGATIIGSLLGMIITGMIEFIMTQTMPDISNLALTALGGILGIGMIEGIQIPFIYKLGAEKGRIYMFMATVAIALLFGGIAYLGERFGKDFLGFHIFNQIDKVLPLILMVLIVLTYTISYKISYHIYRKKEV